MTSIKILREHRQKSIQCGCKRAIWIVAIREEQIRNFLKYNGCLHFYLDGKEFDLIKGMPFEGKSIFPGEEDGCRCFYRPIIPGSDNEFNGRAEKIPLKVKLTATYRSVRSTSRRKHINLKFVIVLLFLVIIAWLVLK